MVSYDTCNMFITWNIVVVYGLCEKINVTYYEITYFEDDKRTIFKNYW